MKNTFFKLATCVTLLNFCVSIASAQAENPSEFTQNIRVVPQTVSSCGLVRIDVAVQYLGTTPRKAWLPVNPKGEVTIEVSRLNPLSPAEQKSISVPGYYLYTDAHRDELPPYDFTIPPRASSTFPIEAVYDYHKQRFLFEEAGQYRIVIRSSIPITDKDGDTHDLVLASEGTLTVTEYQGKDKELWKRAISNVGWRGGLTPETLQALSNLVEQFPQSPYRPYALAILSGAFSSSTVKVTSEQRTVYLREVLAKYPQFAWRDRVAANLHRLLMNQGEVEQAQEVIKILFDDPWAPPPLKYQIRQIQPSVIYPKDKRLNQQVTYQYLEQTPYQEVLADLSKQTGVSLSLHPDLQKRSRSNFKITEPLRETMLNLGSYKAMWIREGDGYKLIPKPNIEE